MFYLFGAYYNTMEISQNIPKQAAERCVSSPDREPALPTPSPPEVWPSPCGFPAPRSAA